MAHDIWGGAVKVPTITEEPWHGVPYPKPRCWQCGVELTTAIVPFCSLQCEHEYNKVGF